MPDAESPRPMISPAAPATASPGMTINVFGRGEDWQVKAAARSPVHYDTREGAVIAAQEAALAAARDGCSVEFFLQEEDGTLRQTMIGPQRA
jgi:hypothetical protein